MGDVCFEEVCYVVLKIILVFGGVGFMIIVMFFLNIFDVVKRVYGVVNV